MTQLLSEGLIEETMMTIGGKATYRVTERGRRHAERAMEVCGYLGPAPVSLEAYSAMLRWEFARAPEVKPEHVTAALSGLVLTEQAVRDGRAGGLVRPQPVRVRAVGQRQEQRRPADPQRPAGRLLDPLLHQPSATA